MVSRADRLVAWVGGGDPAGPALPGLERWGRPDLEETWRHRRPGGEKRPPPCLRVAPSAELLPRFRGRRRLAGPRAGAGAEAGRGGVMMMWQTL